jgi:YidC/Oxa1 family membrane protein insertase
LDFLLPIWNPFIVHPLEQGLRLLATPLEDTVGPGAAGGLAIILFTIFLRLVLVPLSLVQIRSQRAQMAIQPEVKAIQRKFKGDREGLARAQMALYKERGINPAAGCVPLLIQMPILFGMYAAMNQLATAGLTLDQMTVNQVQPGQIVYAAERRQDPLPFNQFVLTRFEITLTSSAPVDLKIDPSRSSVRHAGVEILDPNSVQGLTLTPGSVPNSNQNPPNPTKNAASIFLRSGVLVDGTLELPTTLDRNRPVQTGQPYVIEVWVNAAETNADQAQAVVTYDDPTLLQITAGPVTPMLEDIAFKSRFLWLPSLGQPDTVHIPIPGLNFPIPGLLLIVMTITSFVSQRMTTMPTEDPQQQAMMRSMAFMPLMYLFFFVQTPAGLVLYWLTSNVFSMFQQYFTVGLGMLGGDLQRMTGRDLQPPWAHLPGSTAPVAALTAEPGNGRADSNSNHKDGRSPGPRPGATGATRRPRPGQGKGRKRGKR